MYFDLPDVANFIIIRIIPVQYDIEIILNSLLGY